MTLVEVEDIVIRDIMHVTDTDERYHSDDEADEAQVQLPIPFQRGSRARGGKCVRRGIRTRGGKQPAKAVKPSRDDMK